MIGIGHNTPPPAAEPVKRWREFSDEERIVMSGRARTGGPTARKLAAGGEYYWVHPDAPDSAFASRKKAVEYAEGLRWR